MPKALLKAKKMTGAQVSFISLVERPANRMPFHTVKQEKPMNRSLRSLDLGSIFKSEDAKPEIVGVVVMKTEHFDNLKTQITETGFITEDQQEAEDKSVVFKQKPDISGPGVVIKMSPDVAVVVKGFTPYDMNMNVGDKTFKEAVAEQGFYPSLSTVLDVLSSTVFSAVEKAETTEAASLAIGTMFDEVKKYTQSMVSAMPAKAFKLEAVATDLDPEPAPDDKAPADPAPADPAPAGDEPAVEVVEKMACPADMDKTKWEAMSPEERKAHVAKKDEPASVQKDSKTDSVDDAKPQKGLTVEDVTGIVSTQVEAMTTALTQKMGEMVEGLTTKVNKSVEDLAKSVEKAAEKATKAEETLRGLAGTGDRGGDPEPVRKSASRVFGREIDTAFNPSVRTRR